LWYRNDARASPWSDDQGMTTTALTRTPLQLPARLKVAAGATVVIGLMTLIGSFVFAEWHDSELVPFTILALAMGGGMIGGAVVLLRGNAGAVAPLLTLVGLHLVFDIANIVVAGETEVAPFTLLQLAILAILARSR
jgi:hypothetical protein